ncbi:MAG TPA: magnesium transporter [Chthoniobacteraceae bacterium]|jgi:magnesium transporter
MADLTAHLNASVLGYARADFPLLRRDSTIDEALQIIREKGVGERIIYFYVIDAEERLVGVLPTRRLLTAMPEAVLSDVMIPRVVAIPQTATLLDACELFVLHKFFAFPVVDAQRHVVGVIDVSVFTEEVLELGAQEKPDDVFEAIGFSLSQVKDASPIRAFRFRFPWLLATVASGTAGAFLAGAFEATLARALILSFFLALVLALAEAVSIQTMTLTIQALRTNRPTTKWFIQTGRRELGSALLLGGACGLLVFLIAWIWRGSALAAGVIGISVLGGIIVACLAGFSVPAALHALRLDPKIAAGPITLAATDVLTLLFYFSLATWLL